MLASFEATQASDYILIEWQSSSAASGFNLWRSTEPLGMGEQLNGELILSQATSDGQGGSYQWQDHDVEEGVTYYYFLECVVSIGLPAGSWGAADGPTQFDILDPMPILLNPGEYGTVDVRVYYPDSFAAGNPGPAYFAAIVTNLSSGTTFTCQAALWPVLPWWTGPVNLGIGGIPPGFSKGVAFRVMNNNDDQNRTLTASETITYTVRAMTPGIEDSDDGSSSIVSLNGQPAGETISGQVTLEAGAETTVNIGVEFMEEGGLGPTDILFEMDIDGDGNPDAITTGIVQAVDAEGATQIFLPLISR